MSEKRKYVMTIAGLDPSAGAGLLADIKTFEEHKVYGLAVNTANTIQTENKFHSLNWEKSEVVLKTIEVLMNEYEVSVVKTGIVPSFNFLAEVVEFIHSKSRKVKIIVDPVITSSTGFNFIGSNTDLEKVLKQIYLITPNANEAIALTGKKDAVEGAKELAMHTNVLLKGGHNANEPGLDILFSANEQIEFRSDLEDVYPKHGSGCILSAAITSNLALGKDLDKACGDAKKYIEKILMSNSSLLAYHVQ